jgi:Sec7-like guanine-nucleotide exchange factor
LADAVIWEKRAELANNNPKEFLNDLVNNYYIDENLDEKAEKIGNFLHLSHYVLSDKVIEIVGANKPLNVLILKKFIQALDFRGMGIV